MAASAGSDLKFVTRRLDTDVDLVHWAGSDGLLFARNGVGFAARGEAMRVPARKVLSTLQSFDVDDQVGLAGCGPIAVGALHFTDAMATDMVIPRVVIGRSEQGTRFITTVAGDPAPVLTAPSRWDGVPEQIRVASTLPSSHFTDAVDAVVARLRRDELTKVVLARTLDVSTDTAIVKVAVLDRLRASFSSCYLFSVDGLIGASPELLVSRTGDIVRSHPLAGTVPRTGDPTTDARLAAGLLSSEKDQWEHRVTIDMVHETLLPWCSYLDEEPEPSIVTVANVQHLGTMVEGRLSAPAADVLDLVDALHPTPAVGGLPRHDALAIIDELEGIDRGRYAGPVGWVDRNGDGAFAVALRCAQVDGTSARLYAGVGVVADSDPDAELAETRAKFQAVLSALVRP
jgi:isochorismate synthase